MTTDYIVRLNFSTRSATAFIQSRSASEIGVTVRVQFGLSWFGRINVLSALF